MTQAILIPDGVEDWLAKTGPLHLLVGRLPDGWVDLTLTNATGRGDIHARVAHHWDENGARRIDISVSIPGERRLPSPESREAPMRNLPPRDVVRRLTPPRPVIRVAVNPVTGTPHIINNGTGRTGCGRHAAHGFAVWEKYTAETDKDSIYLDDDICRKCLQWFKREYDV